MSHPTVEDAARLAAWQPSFGVLSIYLRLDPGDRGGAWRTELRNGLAAAVDGAADLGHDARGALRATAERVEERFAAQEWHLPRGEVGFVEVAAAPGEQSWWSTHLEPESADAVGFSARPLVAPLLCMIERGTPRGAALLSAERVRLLEWVPGHVEELESRELSVFGDAGRDRFDERMAESRRRFLGECGGLAARCAADRLWACLLLFGGGEQIRDFRHGVPPSLETEIGDAADLISETAGRLEAPFAMAVERLDAKRQQQIVERTLEEARGGMRGTAGPQETLVALREGRVDRLVLDAALAGRASTETVGNGGVSASAEVLVRQALDSSAAVSTIVGDAAELLAPVDGVAALLRY